MTGAEFSNQFSATNRLELCNDSTKDGLTLNRSRAGIPKLSITGSRNDLEYYSSDGEEEGGVGGGGDGLMMAIRAGRRLGGGLRNLRNRKAGLIIPDSALPSANVDILGSIMNEQERWMTISNPRNINKIKIKADGRLEYEGDNEPRRRDVRSNGDGRVPGRQVASGVAEIASNNNSTTVSGGGTTAVPGSNNSDGVTTSTNSVTTNNGTTANGSATTGSGGGSAGDASTSNGENSGTTSGFTDMRTAAARKAPPTTELKVSTEKNGKWDSFSINNKQIIFH